jgi:hypothetical protein
MRRISAGAMSLAVAAIALTACGQFSSGSSDDSGGQAGSRPDKLFPEDFHPTCEGKPSPYAKAYDPAAPVHKVVMISSYRDIKLSDGSRRLPADWTVKYKSDGDAFAEVDLTVCVVRTAETFAKDCNVDHEPSPLLVKMHSATYAMSVHEAKTGKELAAKTVAANDTTCPPYIIGGPKDTNTMNEYAEVKDAEVVAFAKPFVKP